MAIRVSSYIRLDQEKVQKMSGEGEKVRLKWLKSNIVVSGFPLAIRVIASRWPEDHGLTFTTLLLLSMFANDLHQN